MLTFISFLLVTLAVLLVIPIAIFFIEVVAAIALPQRDCPAPPGDGRRQRVAVLLPAHNESTGILPTLADIKAQIRAGDRLLVVADNCTDDTAAVAAAAGAEVVDRNEPERRGKGYALAWGLRHLGVDPPEIVIIIDADCRLAEGVIDRLAAACAVTHRPVQALDLMTAPDASPINFRVAEFAWRLKNWVRPLGLRALGLPCQLMGTGMAFPWDVIRSADLASGSIVEDLKLGLDLALAGNPPIFCPSPGVISDFPLTVEGIQSQRLTLGARSHRGDRDDGPTFDFFGHCASRFESFGAGARRSGSAAFSTWDAGDGHVGGRRYGDIAWHFFRSDICQFDELHWINRWRLPCLAKVWS